MNNHINTQPKLDLEFSDSNIPMEHRLKTTTYLQHASCK